MCYYVLVDYKSTTKEGDIMTNIKALEIALVKVGLTKKDYAKALGISVQALYNKINNSVEFKVSEIIKSCEVLNLSPSERDEIFFSPLVA